jgi:hypothetical protein
VRLSAALSCLPSRFWLLSSRFSVKVRPSDGLDAEPDPVRIQSGQLSWEARGRSRSTGTCPWTWFGILLTSYEAADRLPRRVMSVIGYICAFIVVLAILYGGWLQTVNANATNQMEPYVFTAPARSYPPCRS